MFENAIKDVKITEETHSQYGYASELGYCLRKLYYRRKGYVSQHDFSTAVNFAEGTAVHELIQSLFASTIAPQLGFRSYAEVKLHTGNIHGFIDVMLVNDTDIIIIEIKTAKSLPSEPLKHHVRQINTYLHPYVINKNKNHKNVKGILYYVEKAIMYGNSPQREFEVEYSDDLYKETISREKEIEKDVDNNILPPAEALAIKDYWQCRYCSYFTMCRKSGKYEKDDEI